MQCGYDACGNSCGSCASGESCSGAGQCVAGETDAGLPDADACHSSCAGKQCGDDGCGNSCGSCSAGSTCTPAGTCTVCTPGETRCVAGTISAVEACNAAGTAWTQSTCSGYSLCSNSACRVVCELTAPPAYPTLCVVPNQDGVNDGPAAMWSDPRLAPPNNAHAGTTSPASIYAAPGEAWPYAWNFGSTNNGYIQFLLNQFPGGRTVFFYFRARRSGVVNGSVNNYLLGVYNGSTPIDSGTVGPVPYAFTTTWVSSSASFNYGGGWNSVLFSITGDGFGGPIDLMDVSWIRLEVH
jgi:hypothetical protein